MPNNKRLYNIKDNKIKYYFKILFKIIKKGGVKNEN